MFDFFKKKHAIQTKTHSLKKEKKKSFFPTLGLSGNYFRRGEKDTTLLSAPVSKRRTALTFAVHRAALSTSEILPHVILPTTL